ncbi:MAG TPA: EthD domain-containing protein [Solirubrobacteraceae bacterium]|nr:EthD domain-containing protein [Solirubrobacteraceae bacterium]
MVASGPITRVGMAPRVEGLTFEAAQEHWRTAHGDVASGIPGLQSYVQNHAVLRNGVPLLPYAGFDACSELEFADFDAMRAGFASEHYQTAVRADEMGLIDKSRFMMALTRRRVIADGEPPDGAVKLMSFLRAHPISTPEALVEALEGPYAEAAREAGPLRHELLVTDAREHEPALPPCCDAIDILWFGSPEDALDALTGVLSERPGWLLAGVAFGAARLIAQPIRQR